MSEIKSKGSIGLLLYVFGIWLVYDGDKSVEWSSGVVLVASIIVLFYVTIFQRFLKEKDSERDFYFNSSEKFFLVAQVLGVGWLITAICLSGVPGATPSTMLIIPSFLGLLRLIQITDY